MASRPMTAPAENNPLGAALWMIGAILSFTSMAVAGRAVSFELDTFEIMMYRSFIGIGVVLAVVAATRRGREITRRSLGLHLVRNLTHFAGQNLWFYAIAVIPLAQVFALEFTMPIWVMFLAVPVLGEALTRVRLLAALVGFAGILLVTRPWASGLSPGIITAALAAVGFAGSAVFTRLLTRTETILCILFWLTLMQAAFGIVCAGYDADIAMPSARSWPWIVMIGLAGLIAHFCLTRALSMAPAAVVTPMDFARLPIVAVVGAAFYGESLHPLTFLGAALIFGANYANLLAETRHRRHNPGNN